MVVVIWDFNWTIANENTDTWVVQELEPGLMLRFNTMKKTHGLGWTEVMREQMNALHKLGRTEKDIREALHRIPVEVGVVEALKLIDARGGTQFVVSDANVFFIDAVCQHHNISTYFKDIHSNKGHFSTDGKLIVEPYHCHGCEDCPPNMCKANIVNRILRDEELLLGHRPQPVVYIGDGRGDEHPCRSELTSKDLVLARKGDTFSLWRRLAGYPPHCQVQYWSNASELRDMLLHFFHGCDDIR